MISFPTLGYNVRLGNKMFQYAFLRSTANRLGVKFYCPSWQGELLFTLNDQDERVSQPEGITKHYRQESNNPGFSADALNIEDNTEIFGYFQSEKYYHKSELVRQWFSFQPEKIASIQDKFKEFDFTDSVGIHLRFGDVVGQLKRPPMRRGYYKKALSYIPNKNSIVIFSDEPERAKQLLEGVADNPFFVTGNQNYEDLFLMTQCRHFICSYSTFSWWGAWLGTQEDRVVIYPQEGQYRPGYGNKAKGTSCENWQEIPSLRGFFDDYRLVSRLEKRLPRFISKLFY
ncbi:alpha-1,2-fucosyltransferase [Crocosphaera sp. XPORK-15E]|uniref:alpha-1,2-fucosyltransferase n=1 Tax=Crocosphaera sp. XPORK-15E TaxID=3110247 RepID=UPI002B21F1ED|nr:alpha-1,2-fucosyltransferase [Crocosphaera sp. XPORK-15E]MEA5534719.1 alpha-1,2-fucosyltransferase [Crocosphaera sp. XPORK-15E]